MSQSQSDSWAALQRRLAAPVGKLDGGPVGVEDKKPPAQVFVPRSLPHVSTDVCVPVCLVSFGPAGDVCGGRVGGSASISKFCTAPCTAGTSKCKVAAHAQKAIVAFPAYYICTSKPGVAFTQPFVRVPEGGVTELVAAAMSDKRILREWTDLFSVLNGFSDEISQTEAVEHISKVMRKTTVGLTPMKSRKRSESAELLEEMELIAESESWTGGSKLKSTLLDEYADSDAEVLSHIRANWNHLAKAALKQRDELAGVDISLRDLLEEVDVKILKTSSLLGLPGDDAPALTAWNAINEIAHMLTSFESSVTNFSERSKDLSMSIDRVKMTVDTAIFPMIEELVTKVKDIEANGTSPDSRITFLIERIQQCETEIGELKQVRNEPLVEPGQDIMSLRMMVGELKTEVASLTEDNKKLRGELNTEQITFGGFTFTSSLSYLSFVGKHIKSNQWMYCYDFISIFELHSDQGRTTDEALQTNHLVGKVGYTNIQAARIDNSFRLMIPQIFGAEQDPKDPSKKMAKLVSMDIWDHPTTQSGMKEDINSFLEMNTSSLLMQIDAIFHENSRAALFFTQMINNVVTFWNGLDAWITRFEKELTSQMGGDNPKVHKESVWKLICWMLHAMFKEMHKRRQPGAIYPVFTTGTSCTDESLQLKCASIIHGSMAAHKFMKELLTDGFIRHPIFASTMVEYLLKNKAAHASMTELTSKYTALDSRVKGNQVAIDRLSNEKKKGFHPDGGNKK